MDDNKEITAEFEESKDEEFKEIFGSLNLEKEINDQTNVTLSLGDVPEVPLDDLDVRLLWDDNGDRKEDDIDVTENGDGSWMGLIDDEKVQDGAEFIFTADDLGDFETDENHELVRIDYRVDNYHGVLNIVL